ncbi:MAG TPA: aspartate kinase [Clostridiales bacterium]|nr:MAG: aspartate kinase [Clostridiales bacterium GWD2_32_59]HAN09926.1 aspartate kinase [Clostridiales bacterium]
MSIIVQKFGGTSLKTGEARQKATEKVIETFNAGNRIAVVVSAIGRKGDFYATDTLINLVNEIDVNINKRDLDLIMSCGETISAVIFATLLNKKGYKAVALTGTQAGIITDNNYGNAETIKVYSQRITKLLDQGVIPVIAGFQGVTQDGDITTLGRGGSDTTASIIAEAIEASFVEIYTDVDGLMTADPKICETARIIEEIGYNEVFQLADNGSKVIHPKAVDIVRRANIEMKIKNTFSNHEGTKITYKHIKDADNMEDRLITGIASLSDRAQVIINEDNLYNEEIFEEMAENMISIDMINVYVDKKAFIINKENVKKMKEILDKYDLDYLLNEDCAKVTIIGNKMSGVPGVMNKVIKSLKRYNVEILQTVDSLATIAILIKKEDLKIAVNELHREFGI